jgi:hypothetical protein
MIEKKKLQNITLIFYEINIRQNTSTSLFLLNKFITTTVLCCCNIKEEFNVKL